MLTSTFILVIIFFYLVGKTKSFGRQFKFPRPPSKLEGKESAAVCRMEWAGGIRIKPESSSGKEKSVR